MKHFLKTKTQGTILLLFTYSLFTLAEILITAGQWYYTFVSETNPITGYLELSFAFFYAIGYIFFYFFANRHILEDNDIVKSLTSVLLTVIVSLATSFMFSEIVNQAVDPVFYNEVIINGPNFTQYLPTLLSGLMIILPIFFFIHLRIIFGIAKIRKSIEDPVSKIGFNFIFYTIISFVLSTVIASAFIIPNIGNHPGVITTLHTLRSLIVIVAVFLGYFGWTLPNWLRKRIQNKNSEKQIQ